MNEAELVDVALGVLAESLGRERAEEKARSESEEEQEQQPAPSSSPESAAGVGTGGDRSPGLPSPPGAGAERTVGEDSEEDVLKYVREIFFT
ncbi:cell cycle regulator of non-homologous end joining [Cygnus olor]|uniref:cell cycle regulator of non-homologous end joining n=1 Tax=Cygnus olor TaxID=8869 RepID=UPI001ADE1047|nr:cell cycle regulator of non-homologous end joining [Cygnus olor]